MTKKRIDISISNDERYARRKLADVVPLRTPYSIDFAPTTSCNIKCIFCAHSSTEPIYKKILGQKAPVDSIKKVITDCKGFPDKIKAVHFCGLGEPLIHPDIAELIAYAKKANIAEKIDINTNGLLLTNKMSNDLVESRIDFIRISVNGISDDDFMTFCNAKIDFIEYVNNIKYLYEHRKNTKIYIKILNIMVETKEKKEKFYSIFEPICDVISIENYSESFLDFKGRKELKDTYRNHRGEDALLTNYCPHPFFKLSVMSDKTVLPCVACAQTAESGIPFSVGNAEKESIVEIWNGIALNKFRLKMLKTGKNSIDFCKSCRAVNLSTYSDDAIDSEVERLKKYYQEQIFYGSI